MRGSIVFQGPQGRVQRYTWFNIASENCKILNLYISYITYQLIIVLLMYYISTPSYISSRNIKKENSNIYILNKSFYFQQKEKKIPLYQLHIIYIFYFSFCK